MDRLLVGELLHPRQPSLEPLGGIGQPLGGDPGHRARPAGAVQANRGPEPRQLIREPLGHAGEAGVDFFRHLVPATLPVLLQPADQPGETGLGLGGEVLALLVEPLEVGLEVAALPGAVGHPLELPQRPLADGGTELGLVSSEGTAQPADGDPEVVEPFGIGGVGQPVAQGGGGLEVLERQAASAFLGQPSENIGGELHGASSGFVTNKVWADPQPGKPARLAM